MNWSLITGASSGIGAATAKALAANNKNVWLLARREDRLKTLAGELKRQNVQVKISVLDVQSQEDFEAWRLENSADLEKTEVLINNAGLALGVNKIQSGSLSDWQTMIDTNLMGLLRMSQAVLPHFCKNGRGHVVNIGSVAGRWVYPGGNVYSATKSAVHALSTSMRLDLLGTGVRVTEISPGMVETEFSEVRLNDKQAAKKVYDGIESLTPTDIANSIVWCLNQPQHVNIQELVIYPTQQAAPGHVYRREV